MRLAISNIAWDASQDEAIAVLLRQHGVDAIDVAPSKYFPEPVAATTSAVARIRQWWAERNVEITGMQALLFGTSGLNVFGSPATQDAMLRHLNAICRVGAGLGASRLVFGSPKNRDRTGLSDAQALDISVRFFRRLGDIAEAFGVTICLEPTPEHYGANFMTTSAETAEVVRHIAHSSIAMQFDAGALTLNREDPAVILSDCAPLIKHVHASEPDLLPLGDGGTDHDAVSAAVRRWLPDHLVCIEMLPSGSEPTAVSIGRAMEAAIRHYRAHDT